MKLKEIGSRWGGGVGGVEGRGIPKVPLDPTMINPSLYFLMDILAIKRICFRGIASMTHFF